MTTIKRVKVHKKIKFIRKMGKRNMSTHKVTKNQARLRGATVLLIASYAWILSMHACRHVAAPPTVITGVVLEGPQCSHTADYECLVAYNAQYLRNIRARDLQCPACSQPFPVPGELSFSDEENDEGSEDNAFEYEKPDEESEESEGAQDDGGNSVDEYHASVFSSSSDSDEDYAP
ncbi:hypothetical protein PInf_008668 [Phytophthora infestans]|nr:hypothetical protein PInf_008668 [Phytophthora infestans]